MPGIQANGSVFEYRESGSGTPVVFVHGAVNDHRTWEGQIDSFSRRYRVVAYSRRFHYPNPWPGDDVSYSLSLHADDLAALIGALNLAPAHLIGSSYGAYTALTLAVHRPELVRSLVLGEPPVLPLLTADPQDPREMLKLLTRDPRAAFLLLKLGIGTMEPTKKAVQRGDIERALELFVDGVLGKGGFNQLPSSARTMVRDNAASLGPSLADKFEPFPEPKVRAFDRPVLLVCGERSPKLFRRLSDELLTIFPNAEKVTLPGVSHTPHGEDPGAYNQTVLRFLRERVDDRQGPRAPGGGETPHRAE
jgi:pimeloyl-ACP methyl ester carboxylesterase